MLNIYNQTCLKRSLWAWRFNRNNVCVTFSVATETHKSLSHFHQQSVGTLTSSDWHLLCTNDHLKNTTSLFLIDLNLCVYVCARVFICVGTSGSSALIKSLCSSFNLLTMWIRHLSLGCGNKRGDKNQAILHTETCSPTGCLCLLVYTLTLFAGEEAFFRVSSSTTLSVSRFDVTNDLHASLSPPHISSSTRYAFFCMLGSLVWGK